MFYITFNWAVAFSCHQATSHVTNFKIYKMMS